MLFQAEKDDRSAGVTDPILVSKNYSLFTPTLGGDLVRKDLQETVGEGSTLNLKQFDVGILSETDLIETSESIDFTVRFPVFQLEKPVSEWFYNFNLKDFKKALHHIEENCTPVKLVELISQEG